MLESDVTTRLVFPPGHDADGRIARRLKLLLVACLLALSAAYLGKGFFISFIDSSDAWRRWLEERFVLRGQIPNPQIAATLLRRGVVVYPPWSYFSGALLF